MGGSLPRMSGGRTRTFRPRVARAAQGARAGPSPPRPASRRPRVVCPGRVVRPRRAPRRPASSAPRRGGRWSAHTAAAAGPPTPRRPLVRPHRGGHASSVRTARPRFSASSTVGSGTSRRPGHRGPGRRDSLASSSVGTGLPRSGGSSALDLPRPPRCSTHTAGCEDPGRRAGGGRTGAGRAGTGRTGAGRAGTDGTGRSGVGRDRHGAGAAGDVRHAHGRATPGITKAGPEAGQRRGRGSRGTAR